MIVHPATHEDTFDSLFISWFIVVRFLRTMSTKINCNSETNAIFARYVVVFNAFCVHMSYEHLTT